MIIFFSKAKIFNGFSSIPTKLSHDGNRRKCCVLPMRFHQVWSCTHSNTQPI